MPSDPTQDDDETLPNSKSSGNEGARGSRGQANSGAQGGNSTNKSELPEPSPGLRDVPDAQGGGGVGSESSRSS
jgi:hypothetical protein